VPVSDTPQLVEPPARPARARPGAVAASGGLRAMGRGALAMGALTLLASAVNYASTLVFSRLLSPASFGDLTALLALSVVLAVPTGAAQTVVAERIASHRAAGDEDRARYLLRHALAHVGVVAVLAGALYAAAIPLVDRALDLQAPGPAIALTPVIALSFVVPVLLGALQGMERFIAFGLMSLAIAVARVAFGVPWVELGGGSGGAIAGQGLGMLVVLVVALWLLRDRLARRGAGAATSGLRRRPDVRAVSASTAFIGFALLSNLDILLAKVFLDAEEVGIYAALATIGKVVTFLPAAVALVSVPSAARARAGSRERVRVLRVAALLVALTTAVFAVPAAVAPELVVRVMFGEAYLAARSGVLPIVAAGAGLALLYLLVVYSVTIQDRRWVWLLVGGVALQVGAIAAFHGSAHEIAVAQAVVILVVLLVNEAAFHSLVRPVRRSLDAA